MLGWLRGIAEGLGNLAGNITSGITDGIKAIFIPDNDYIDGKVTALRERFGFANSIISVIDLMSTQLSTAVTADEPPRIEIDLSSANGKYNYGGKCYALDMSWYEPYKPMVDDILSMIMWGFFIWRVFVALPNIINGISGTADSMQNYDLSNGTIRLSSKGSKRRGR